ncbi:hypothetical protein DFH09DRAFT_1094423 [Mycena vulgaris]|nr:hypothetical protein DFH09DRAFT_1094423 [Mycena vulgaris]
MRTGNNLKPELLTGVIGIFALQSELAQSQNFPDAMMELKRLTGEPLNMTAGSWSQGVRGRLSNGHEDPRRGRGGAACELGPQSERKRSGTRASSRSKGQGPLAPCINTVGTTSVGNVRTCWFATPGEMVKLWTVNIEHQEANAPAELREMVTRLPTG